MFFFAATLNAGGLTIHRADDGDWDLVHQCLPVPDGRGIVSGFHVESFGSALWGALVVSLTGFMASLLFGDPQQRARVNVQMSGRSSSRPGASPTGRAPNRKIEDDDVIDI